MNQNDVDIIANALQPLVYDVMDDRTLRKAQDVIDRLGYSKVTAGFDEPSKSLVLHVPTFDEPVSIEESLRAR